MAYATLITSEELHYHGNDPAWAVVDCRFSLGDSELGRRSYLEAHVPGAVYAHLDEDLSAPVVPGKTGRHPLPSVAAFAHALSGWGIDQHVQVVAYDDSGGSIAARLWWMIRWMGHDMVAVLDGGFPAWLARGFETRSGVQSRPRRELEPRVRPALVADVGVVERIRSDAAHRLIDARGADRYRGENETIDPVAGHIPGAISLPYADNLRKDGTFRPPEELRARFASQIGDVPLDKVVCYCGSGVTAAHDLLAMAHGGLGDARLYPGSWSEWITDPARPVAP